jgi:hypothetical protein
MVTSSALEEFSKAHEHTIAAFGAVGTVLAAIATTAAVVVSLYLARRSETVRLRVVLGIGLTPNAPSARHVTLQIHNIGIRVGSLPPQFFEWRIPFRRRHQREMMGLSVNSAYLINPQPEINLSFVSNINISELDDFCRQFANQLPLIACKLRWFPKARLRRLGAVIYTNGNRHFKVKISRVIADEISSIVQAYLRKNTSRSDFP